ncbi:bifunctional (p)ppGpp synthetase/guanosine-3',5'-bis(diphosphate) 3'-pyrophosphohydrolase [Dactylosporangium roseum]|uniref:Bifunctional (P)ppGpp synthetase/guanosine-3',5'-bis(Diphosphate) 3'-pyrophosphohydrolase n=1 Tax=Dactylosporangium roseum TaxID=47989 RepID=A0ABY5Z892_9ACTN|nr:HD domain-containing protein [Dactylosporangium roseum]UWZ37771.1 bifunctional (p)ppGpp synthetase/guanosine-3',5'-bis(diphosphate) 3'-pyrophosphohydrolase [Dactylosporangium roseum]
MTRTVNDARELAYAAHRSQVDKAGRPYFEHVAEVARRLEYHSDEAVMAGYLHDIVEDTDVTLDQLRAMGFPEAVVRAVDAVTWREGEDYMGLIARAAADPLGRLVKLADNATNSDEARLALLDEATADRLRRKYARAREVLLAGCVA